MTGLSFGRDLRLTEAADYQQVFNTPDYRIATRDVLLLARINQLPIARLGLAVSKKNVPLAVSRNQIKRTVREIFRNKQQAFAGLDMVFLCRQGLVKQITAERRQRISRAFAILEKQLTASSKGTVL